MEKEEDLSMSWTNREGDYRYVGAKMHYHLKSCVLKFFYYEESIITNLSEIGGGGGVGGGGWIIKIKL